MKKQKRKWYKTELERLNLKVSETEMKRIRAKADKYTDGNISAWLRLAGQNYTPDDFS